MGQERPRARRTDPRTSKDAARTIDELTDRQRAVLTVIKRVGPATDPQIASAYERARERFPEGYPEQSPSGLRTRRAELVDQARVIALDVVRLPTGRRAQRWVATV